MSGAPPFSGRVVHPAGEGIVYGAGSLAAELPRLVRRLGARRACIVTTPSVVRAGLADEVAVLLRDATGGDVAMFAGSREHTPEAAVFEGADVAETAGADVLVSVGGSSVVDLTKGIALVLAEGRDLRALRVGFSPTTGHVRPTLDAPKLPHIAVPTTLSGAEFTGGAGITDTEAGHKRLYHDAKLAPRWVVLDPLAVRATPAPLWASTGMKALADTLEVLCSTRATPLSDAVAAGALRLLVRHLPASTADPDALEERVRCQFAVGMALPQLAAVGVGLVAGLRHQLGGSLGVGHGVASTIVLPHVLHWNRSAAGDALGRAAEAAEVDGVDALVARVEALTAELGLPARLRDVGVQRGDLATVAEHVLGDGAIATNPRPVTTAADVLEVLDAAW